MTREEMVARLALVEDYFDQRADVNWEGDGPNDAMRCQQAVEAVMTALRQPDVFTRALSLLTKTLGEKEAHVAALETQLATCLGERDTEIAALRTRLAQVEGLLREARP